MDIFSLFYFSVDVILSFLALFLAPGISEFEAPVKKALPPIGNFNFDNLRRPFPVSEVHLHWLRKGIILILNGTIKR
jgi:hypothetical protein